MLTNRKANEMIKQAMPAIIATAAIIAYVWILYRIEVGRSPKDKWDVQVSEKLRSPDEPTRLWSNFSHTHYSRLLRSTVPWMLSRRIHRYHKENEGCARAYQTLTTLVPGTRYMIVMFDVELGYRRYIIQRRIPKEER